MAPDSDDDAAALRDRVTQLEQTVADQQQTIEALQQPPVSRRGVLAALTGVAGAGALGAYSQRGAAQAAGQVGTQSEPVDVEAYDLTVQNQLAGDLDAGGNSLTNVGAIETEKLSIGDRIEEFLFNIDGASNGGNFDLSGSDYNAYLFDGFISTGTGVTGAANVRLNGISNPNYDTVTRSGSQTTGVSQFELPIDIDGSAVRVRLIVGRLDTPRNSGGMFFSMDGGDLSSGGGASGYNTIDTISTVDSVFIGPASSSFDLALSVYGVGL
jgi:hypothetical protein